MAKKIKVFGDSHTYGDGLPDCGLDKPWQQHSTLAWPYHMFNKDQIQNFAYPGCANDTVGLKLVRHATKENIVLIMFTYPERLHVIRKGYNFAVTYNGSIPIADNGDENWVAKQIAEAEQIKHRKHMLENYDDNFLEMMFLKNISWCQSFCESKGIEHYFTLVSAREKTQMRGSLEKYRDSLSDSINWKNIFLVDGKYGFDEYALQVNAGKGLDNGHWDIEYHKLFGKLFLDWITEKKQV